MCIYNQNVNFYVYKFKSIQHRYIFKKYPYMCMLNCKGSFLVQDICLTVFFLILFSADRTHVRKLYVRHVLLNKLVICVDNDNLPSTSPIPMNTPERPTSCFAFSPIARVKPILGLYTPLKKDNSTPVGK